MAFMISLRLRSTRHVPESRSETPFASLLAITFDFPPAALIARMRFWSFLSGCLLGGNLLDGIHGGLGAQNKRSTRLTPTQYSRPQGRKEFLQHDE